MIAVKQWKKNIFFRHSVVAIFFFCLAFFLYHSIINVGFLSDDWHSLSIASQGGSILRFFSTNIVGTRVGSTYAPMWNVLFAGEYAVFNLWVTGYHFVSLFLFAGGAFFLYLLASRLFNDWLLGFIAGIIFLFLPSHVESVAWISVQLHLFAALMFVASLVAYERFVVTKKSTNYSLAVSLAFLGLLTKEIGITFIVGFFLIDIYKKTPWKNLLKRLIIPIVIIIVYFVLRFYATGIFFGYYASAKEGKSLIEMLRMFTEMSVNLLFSYPMRVVITNWLMRHLLVYTLVTITFLVITWFIFQKKQKQLILSLALFVVTSLPLLSVAYNNLGNEGERYVYLPSFFAALFVAICLRSLLYHLRYQSFYLCGILLFIGIISWSQISLKTNDWVLAGRVVESGLKSFSSFNFSPTDEVVFIGLPDNLNGAQLFRNATKEALYILGTSIQGGERVLMSPLLTKENFNKDLLVNEKPDNLTILLKPVGNTLIFGFPKVETKYGLATLLNFNKQYQTGDAIEFKINMGPVVEARGAGKTIFLVWYSAGRFQAVQLF